MSGPSKQKKKQYSLPGDQYEEKSSPMKPTRLCLPLGRIVIIAGMGGSGKSNLIHYLCVESAPLFAYGLILSPTSEDGAYNYFDVRYVQSHFDEGFISAIIEQQKLTHHNNVLLILDDCLGSVHWNSDIMTQLLTCSRRFRITCVISTQYISKLPTFVRECATEAYVYAQKIATSLKAVHETFLMEKFARSQEAIPWFQKETSIPFSALHYNKLAAPDLRYETIIAPNMDEDKRKIRFYV